MVFLGIDIDTWPKLVAWVRARHGAPRYMAAREALMWCKFKWESAGRPLLDAPPNGQDVRRAWDGFC